MKPQRVLAIFLCLAFCGGAFAQVQDMDKELSDLTEKLATKIKAVAKKKITVLDFTDLDGGTSDLGKYVAEQVTVAFVTGDRQFIVVDRANLKKILDEHQLTAKGLVDPENAKKFAGLSGVDALILGTVVPMATNIKLTAKIISTENGDIVGAGQCTFKSDENVQQLLAHTAPEAKSDSKPQEAKRVEPKAVSSFGDLTVIVESINGRGQSVTVNLIFQNKSSKKTIAVAVHTLDYLSRPKLESSMVGADATKWHADTSGLTGIRAILANPKSLSPVEPGKELKAAVTYESNEGISQFLTSFRLHLELVVNADYNESQYDNYRIDTATLPPYCKIVNVTVDIPVNQKKK